MYVLLVCFLYMGVRGFVLMGQGLYACVYILIVWLDQAYVCTYWGMWLPIAVGHGCCILCMGCSVVKSKMTPVWRGFAQLHFSSGV